MDFIENPGFSNTANQAMEDSQRSSGSSNSSNNSQRSCIKCNQRMSSIDRDRHKTCVKCRGFDCCLELRCTECEAWTEEEMTAYVKVRKTLASKGKGKGKSSKTSKPSSPPQSSADSNLDARFDALCAKLSSELDTKFDNLSMSIVNQVSVLVKHSLKQLTSSDLSGDTVENTDPEPTSAPQKYVSHNAAERGLLVRQLKIGSLAPVYHLGIGLIGIRTVRRIDQGMRTSSSLMLIMNLKMRMRMMMMMMKFLKLTQLELRGGGWRRS